MLPARVDVRPPRSGVSRFAAHRCPLSRIPASLLVCVRPGPDHRVSRFGATHGDHEPAGDAIQQSSAAHPGNPPEQPDNPDRIAPTRQIEKLGSRARLPVDLRWVSRPGARPLQTRVGADAPRPPGALAGFAGSAADGVTGCAPTGPGTGRALRVRGACQRVGRPATAARMGRSAGTSPRVGADAGARRDPQTGCP